MQLLGKLALDELCAVPSSSLRLDFCRCCRCFFPRFRDIRLSSLCGLMDERDPFGGARRATEMRCWKNDESFCASMITFASFGDRGRDANCGKD